MTYITTADHAKQIRVALKKEHGWTGRDVSVRTDNYSMGSSIRIAIKKRGIDKQLVENAARGHESIRRDHYSGDILSGGNRFVSVDYDYDFLRGIGNEIKEEVKAVWAKLKETPGFQSVKMYGCEIWCDLDGHTPRALTLKEHNDYNFYCPKGLVIFLAQRIAKGNLEVAK